MAKRREEDPERERRNQKKLKDKYRKEYRCSSCGIPLQEGEKKTCTNCGFTIKQEVEYAKNMQRFTKKL